MIEKLPLYMITVYQEADGREYIYSAVLENDEFWAVDEGYDKRILVTLPVTGQKFVGELHVL